MSWWLPLHDFDMVPVLDRETKLAVISDWDIIVRHPPFLKHCSSVFTGEYQKKDILNLPV
jgi:hypothetical protein